MTFLDDIDESHGLSDEEKVTLKNYYTTFKKSIDDEARRGNNNTLDQTFASGLSVHCETAVGLGENGAAKIFDLRSHWYVAFQAAQHYAADGPKHESLIYHILRFRQLGVLKRESGFAVGSRLWRDPLLLLKDATEFMENVNRTGDEQQRENFAAFLAKLFATGICNNQFGGCLLRTFIAGLETERPLTNSSDPNILSFWHYMPMVKGWIDHSRMLITALCAEDCMQDLHDLETFGPGPLARKAGVTRAGFSHRRWAFWRDRLQSMGSLNPGDCALQALQCVGLMEESAQLYGHILDVTIDESDDDGNDGDSDKHDGYSDDDDSDDDYDYGSDDDDDDDDVSASRNLVSV